MDWFEQLRAALGAYYTAAGSADVVGYLRGSNDPAVWKQMLKSGKEQMLILGNTPPSDADWNAAGVSQRGSGATQPVRLGDLNGLIITYGGMFGRPWGKISQLSVETFRSYGSITIPQFTRNLPKPNTKLIDAMNDVITRIEKQANMGKGDHLSQGGLTTGSAGNFSGFWGYWTNHLFNSDVPPITIWNKCFAEVDHARSTLKEGKIGESMKTIVRARFALFEATSVYYRWKNGIEFAGTQMQAAIGAVAFILITSAVAATLITAGGVSAAATGTAASSTTAVESLTSTLGKADAVFARVVATAAGGATAPAAQEYERLLETLDQEIDQIVKGL